MNSKEVPYFDADLFKWSKNYGRATYADLGCMPTRFFCSSPKTGVCKYFTIDQWDAGYEDHWDGEFVKLADQDREFFITVSYE